MKNNIKILYKIIPVKCPKKKFSINISIYTIKKAIIRFD